MKSSTTLYLNLEADYCNVEHKMLSECIQRVIDDIECLTGKKFIGLSRLYVDNKETTEVALNYGKLL